MKNGSMAKPFPVSVGKKTIRVHRKMEMIFQKAQGIHFILALQKVNCISAFMKKTMNSTINGMDMEMAEIKNRFEIRLKNERAYHAVVDMLTYYDVERTAFSIINHYLRFVDREDGKPKSQWKINADWAWFIGEHREKIKLTTQPKPFTLQKALNWLHRQVAPTLRMVEELDKQNHTTILRDMLDNADLKKKHRHLLQLEKSTPEYRIDTAVSSENDGIF